MDVTLYGFEISHPTHAARLMLAHKGIEHKTVDLPPGSQPLAMRAVGFRGATVPGLKVDGRKVQTTRAISRALDQIQADPPLFPADPELRAAVEEAERWGDEVYQPVPRRAFRWALTEDRDLRLYLAREMEMPAPSVTSELGRPLTAVLARMAGADRAAVEADFVALPSHIDHVDTLIADGTIGGPQRNAADFQIAVTTQVLMRVQPIRELIEGRPAADHARSVATGMDDGEIPIRPPAGWSPPAPAPPPS